MAASVTVDYVAFGDARFRRVAKLLRYADADHARSKLEHVWLACTERGVHSLPGWLIDDCMGREGAHDALVAADLAEMVTAEVVAARADDRLVVGEFRVKGGGGRVEWLVALRAASVEGGLKRAASAVRKNGRFAPAHTSRPPGDAGPAASSPPPAPSSPPTSSPTPTSQIQKKDPLSVSLPAAPPAPRTKAKQATRWPEGWLPDVLQAPPAVDLHLELQRFRDWCAARGQRYVDWNAAWRNWVRKAGEIAARGHPFRKEQSVFDAVDEAAARLKERELKVLEGGKP